MMVGKNGSYLRHNLHDILVSKINKIGGLRSRNTPEVPWRKLYMYFFFECCGGSTIFNWPFVTLFFFLFYLLKTVLLTKHYTTNRIVLNIRSYVLVEQQNLKFSQNSKSICHNLITDVTLAWRVSKICFNVTVSASESTMAKYSVADSKPGRKCLEVTRPQYSHSSLPVFTRLQFKSFYFESGFYRR